MISCFKILNIACLILITSYSSIAQTTEDEDVAFQKLKVGDMAPPIKVAKWVKGNPVTGFVKGHFYIVEFGYIACAPCRAAIPHLTALSKKYSSKATVISVFVFDKVTYVEKFVQKTGNKIEYNVAVDMVNGEMNSTWVKATTRFPGYPSVFLVDSFGKIAWIGTGYYMIEEYLDLLIEGNFDAEKALEQKRALSIEENSIRQDKHENYETSLKKIDSLIDTHPEKKYLYSKKYKILLYNKEKEAYKYGWQLLNSELKDDESNLYSISYQIPFCDLFDLKLEKPDYDLAIALNQRMIELSIVDFNIACAYQNISIAHFRKGDFEKGKLMMEKAINNFPSDVKYESHKKQFFENFGQYIKELNTRK